jgi:hypothetical protein
MFSFVLSERRRRPPKGLGPWSCRAQMMASFLQNPPVVAPDASYDGASDDAAADAIIDRVRHKLRAKQEAHEAAAAAKAGEQAAIASATSGILGHAARTAAARTVVRERRESARRASEAQRIAAYAAACGEVAAECLQSADFLWLLMLQREAEVFVHADEPATDAALHRFCAWGNVCRAWHEAVGAVVGRRRCLVHARQLATPPPPPVRLEHGSFMDVAPTGDVLVTGA